MRPDAAPGSVAPLRLVIAAPPLGGGQRLARLLAQGLGVQALPALPLYLSEDIDGLRQQCTRAQSELGDGILRALGWALEGAPVDQSAATRVAQESDAGIAQAGHWLWRHGESDPRAISRLLAAHGGALVWPDHYLGWRPDYLDRLRRDADVRVLHLVRAIDPHARALLEQARRQGGMSPVFRDYGRRAEGVPDPQTGWYQWHRNMCRWAPALGARYLCLRWEDVVADERGALQRVSAWLGSVGAREARLAPLIPNPRSVTFALRGPSAAPGGFDPAEWEDTIFYGDAAAECAPSMQRWAAEVCQLQQRLDSASRYQAP